MAGEAGGCLCQVGCRAIWPSAVLPTDPSCACGPMQLETDKSKLAYQVLHLKRAVKEADEKLAAAGGGAS